MKQISFLITFCLLSMPVLAEQGGHHHSHGAADLMPKVDIAQNAPSIHIGMDKSELVRLPEPASSIIVGNPVHASVLMDNPKLLVVVPRSPGATHFSVLNNDGEIIYQRHIIVGAPKENYIRVRKASCGEGATDCINTETYFCEREGMCHEIVSMAAEEASKNAAPTSNPNQAASGGGQDPLGDELNNQQQPQ